MKEFYELRKKSLIKTFKEVIPAEAKKLVGVGHIRC
jgi:hypothetical protein